MNFWDYLDKNNWFFTLDLVILMVCIIFIVLAFRSKL
jgi:hypothetical protein